MEFEERRYINYMYVGGNYGIQGLILVGNEKSVLEPINQNIHEEFINKYTLYDVYVVFKKIQQNLKKYWKDARIWKLQDSYLAMTEQYLNELIDKKISHMSICIQRDSGGIFISRLDCLTRDQCDYIMQLLEKELSIIEHSKYKLYELPKFKWEGV